MSNRLIETALLDDLGKPAGGLCGDARSVVEMVLFDTDVNVPPRSRHPW